MHLYETQNLAAAEGGLHDVVLRHANSWSGATLGLIDHAAAPGSPAETGGTLHRIDPEIVKRDFAAAGFVFDAESDVLRNPADDLTKPVFDPAVRGKTDRFVFRFRRP